MWDVVKGKRKQQSLILRAVFIAMIAQCVWLSARTIPAAAQDDTSSQEVINKEPVREVHRPKRIMEQSGGDPRGSADLTVCSQNLKLFGTYQVLKSRDSKYSIKKHRVKVEELAERFTGQKCDVIGVQEVLGKNEDESKAALKELAEELRFRTNRFYDIRVAPPAEGKMTVGFLVAQDRAQITNSLAYSRIELPRINKKQKPRLFSRTPLEIQLAVAARNGDSVRVVSIINFHLKSKRGGEGDPTGLEWETYRMEMAEALRRIIEIRHANALAAPASILIVLGDRNSHFDVATARILEGSLTLASFAENGPCRLSKRAVPICQAAAEQPRKLFSVLTSNPATQSLPGTFSYRGEYSWLDDILMPSESLSFAWLTPHSEGKYDSGVVYKPEDASDHAMVYVRLNW